MEAERAVNIGTEANDIPFRLESSEQPRQMQQKGFLAEEKEIEQEVAELTKDDFSHASDYVEPDTVEIDVRHYLTIDFKREKDESSSVKELVIRTLKGGCCIQIPGTGRYQLSGYEGRSRWNYRYKRFRKEYHPEDHFWCAEANKRNDYR